MKLSRMKKEKSLKIQELRIEINQLKTIFVQLKRRLRSIRIR